MSGPSNVAGAAKVPSQSVRYDEVQLTIKERWTVKKRLGRGTFGIVQKGLDITNRVPVAIKMEPFLVESKKEQAGSKLRKEFEILTKVGAGVPEGETIGFPRQVYFASSDFMRLMVMELLGDTVMKRFTHYHMPLSDVYSVGIQVLNRLEHLHNCGFLHIDIKMDNIMFGRGDRSHYVYLADFGLSERFRKADGSHRPNTFRPHGTGTFAYSSVNMSEGSTPSRRDDVEGLGHVLIWLYYKTLPWISPELWHIRHTQRQPQQTIVLEANSTEPLDEPLPSPGLESYGGGVKLNYPIDRLCSGMPGMAEFMQYIRGLGYEVRPDYKYLRTILRRKMGHTSFRVAPAELCV